MRLFNEHNTNEIYKNGEVSKAFYLNMKILFDFLLNQENSNLHLYNEQIKMLIHDCQVAFSWIKNKDEIRPLDRVIMEFLNTYNLETEKFEPNFSAIELFEETRKEHEKY